MFINYFQFVVRRNKAQCSEFVDDLLGGNDVADVVVGKIVKRLARERGIRLFCLVGCFTVKRKETRGKVKTEKGVKWAYCVLQETTGNR